MCVCVCDGNVAALEGVGNQISGNFWPGLMHFFLKGTSGSSPTCRAEVSVQILVLPIKLLDGQSENLIFKRYSVFK